MQELSVRARIITDLVQLYNNTKYLERRIENEDYGESEMDKPFKYPDNFSTELIDMGDPYTKLKPGAQGVVNFVDDIGTVFVNWDNGSGLGVAYGEDHIRKV